MNLSRFKSIVEYLLDNLFDIATIVVAGILVVNSQVKPPTNEDIPDLLTWILAVLGLVAVSGIWDRNRRLRRIENMTKESKDLILHRVSGKTYANDFFIDKRLTEKAFASAQSIFLAGMTLTRTTREFVHILGQRLINGASIKIIILEPIDPLLQELVLRSSGNTDADYWKSRINTVETLVKIISETHGSTGKLKLGYLPYIPSFGFIMIDPDEANAYGLIELYHHKSSKSNPLFEINMQDDPLWYEFFREQYEILWKSCRIVTFDNEAHKSPKV